MKPFRAMVLVTAAWLCGMAQLRAGSVTNAFIYETAGEFITAGDFNGDTVPDVLVLDKTTGNARVGYGGGSGVLTWSSPLPTGVQNPSGCAVGRFQQTARDTVAVTAPYFNCVNLVDLSQTNTAGTPAVVTAPGVGPHTVLPLANPAGGTPPNFNRLLIASSENVSNAEYLDLMSLNAGVGAEAGEYQESGPFDRGNALALSVTPPTFAVGLVRGATNDTLHIWQFTNTPAVMVSLSNLAPGGDYVFGIFNEETLPRFIFYQPGGTNLTVAPLLATSAGFMFGAPLTTNVAEPIQEIFYLDLTGNGNGNAMIVFGDGVEAMSLPGGVPAFSSLYTSGAASGDGFTGGVPLGAGQFVLLDGPAGSLTSVHGQVVKFDGTHFTKLSSSYLPMTTTRNTRANVWLFQTEPFVNRTPGFIATTNSPDWSDSVTSLPGATTVLTETDNGTNSGLGSAAAVNLGAAATGSAYGLANQYSPVISLFSYGGCQGAQPVTVTISPPPGHYSGPVNISFTTLNPSSDKVCYRVEGSGAWQNYTTTFTLTNDGTIEYYGTNVAQPLRSQLQFAAYTLDHNNQLAQQGAAQGATGQGSSGPGNPTYQLPSVLYDSDSGTLFYGRRSASNVGTIWAIHMDGSDDTFLTQGVRPRASADGRWLAFLREGDPFNNQGNLWERNLLTGQEQRLLVNTNKIVGYDWEPDDSGLVVDYSGAIYKLGTNGVLTLLVQTDGSAQAPVLNPQGGGLAFHDLATNQITGFPGLYVDPFAGIAPSWAPPWQVVTNVPGASWPAWSPDGQLLCFADDNTMQSLNQGTNLWLVSADGSTLNRVCDFTGTDNRFPHGALWTLDGGSLVGAGYLFESNGLWVIALNADRTDCAGEDAARLPTTPGDPIDFAGTVVPATGFYEDPNGNIVTTHSQPVITPTTGDYQLSTPTWLTNLSISIMENGLAVDANGGNVYISDLSDIFQYNLNSKTFKHVLGPYTSMVGFFPAPVLGGDGNAPSGYGGLATDPAGDLFFTLLQYGEIGELTANQLATGSMAFTYPTDSHYNFEDLISVVLSVAVDQSGDLFECNQYGGSIAELPAAGSGYGNPYFVKSNYGSQSNFWWPNSLAVDPAGHLYMRANLSVGIYATGTDGISRFTPGSGWSTLCTFGAYQNSYSPNGLAADGAGNVFFLADVNNTPLQEWLASAQTIINWSAGGAAAVAAADSQGDMFIYGGGALSELQPAMVDVAPVHVPQSGGTFRLPGVINLRGGAADVDLTGIFAPTCTDSNVTLSVGPHGVVSFTCPPNDLTNTANASVKTFSIKLLGTSVPIMQAGNVYSVAATSVTELPAAGSDSVSIEAAPASAKWTAFVWYGDWLNLNTPQGTGSGPVSFRFTANTGGTRTSAISIANGHYVYVTQLGAGYTAASAPNRLMSSLVTPNGVAVDKFGNVYVADSGSKTIQEWVASTGKVITVVNAGLTDPTGVAVDSSGNLYIADGTGGAIYELPSGSSLPAGASALITLTAGVGDAAGVAVDASGNVFFSDSAYNLVAEYIPGTGVTFLVFSGLNQPTGLAVDAYGDVFIADTGDHAIKEWTPSGGLSTIVSTGLDEPTGVAVDAAGNLYIADTGANAIYELPVGGSLTYIADDPNGVAVDSSGNVYFSDGGTDSVDELAKVYVNTAMRNETAAAGTDSLPVVSPATANLTGAFAPTSSQPWLAITGVTNGVVSFAFGANYGAARTADITVLGQSVSVVQSGPTFVLGTTNRVEGAGTGSDSIVLGSVPVGAAWTAAANAPWLHLTPAFQSGTGAANVIFSFGANPGGTRAGTLTLGGQTVTVTQAGAGYVAAGPLTPLITSGLGNPQGVAVDNSGNVYVADSDNNDVVEWQPASNTSGLPVTGLDNPLGVAVDPAGNVYVANAGYDDVLEWQAANNTSSAIAYSSGNLTMGLAVDGFGNVYYMDDVYDPEGSGWISAVSMWSPASGTVNTLPITGLAYSYGLAVDAAGNVYVTEPKNNQVLEWSPATGVTTVLPFANLSNPAGVAVDGAGNVYVVSSVLLAAGWSAALLEWSPVSNAVTVLASGLSNPLGVAVDAVGNVYVTDAGTATLYELPRAFVNPSPKSELTYAGNDSLPQVVPSTINLGGPFAPASSQSWLTITSTNNGVVSFSFTANTTPITQIANINLLGQTIAVSQQGPDFLATTTCTEGTQSGSDSVLLVTTPAFPNWTNAANASWLHLSGGTNGSGSAAIVFGFDANYGDTRTGSLTIDGITFTVTQAGDSYQAANTQVSLIPSGLSQPSAVAVDAGGNVYVADSANADVVEWSPASNTSSPLPIYGLHSPTGVAVDQAGNVYVADPDYNQVLEWSPATGNTTTVPISGLDYPMGVAVDQAGNVYVADSWSDQVLEWSPATGNTTTIPISGMEHPVSVAVDLAGNVYVADPWVGQVLQWSPATSLTTTMPFSGLYNPTSVAVDLGGNVYVTDPDYSNLAEWSVVNNAQITSYFANGPVGVAVDTAGDTYVAEQWGAAVVETPRAFVYGWEVNEQGAAGRGALPPVLPTSANLTGPFAPANDSPSWLTITGVNDGVISFSFTANNDPPRMATLTVLGQNVSIYQYSPNSYSAGTYSCVEGPAAGSDSLVVGVYPATGAWTATNTATPWLHLSSAYQNGIGSTNLIFSFDANLGPTRDGYLIVAGNWITITQIGSNYVAAQQSAVVISSGLNHPAGISVDSLGNVFIANSGGNSIVSWSPTNGVLSPLVSSGLNHPQGVAAMTYDGVDNVFIANTGGNTVSAWLETGTFLNWYAPSYLTNLYSYGSSTPLALPVSVAFNPLNYDFVVANNGAGTIDEFDDLSAYGGTPTRLVSGLTSPTGVAVDAAGNTYIADIGAGQVYQLAMAATNVTSYLSSGLRAPGSVAVDGAGNLYLADPTNNVVLKWTFVSNLLASLPLPPLGQPAGVAVDAAGDVFVANTASNTVVELARGYLDPTPRSETGAAGPDSLPAVLPKTVTLAGVFTPVSDQSWLTVTGVTNGVVSYFCAANTGASRTGHITVLNQSVAVIQSGPSFVLGETNVVEGPAAGTDSVVLGVVPAIASWTASASASWLHLSAANQGGIGGTNVIFSFDANPGTTRVGSLTIGGQTLNVIQAGAAYVAVQYLTNLATLSALSGLDGLAVDGMGDVFYDATSSSQVYEWAPATNFVNNRLGIGECTGLAVDGMGNLYVGSSYGWVYKMETNGAGTWLNDMGSQLVGLASDGAANLYFSNPGGPSVGKWMAANNSVVTLVGSGLVQPQGVAVDAAGNVYIADSGDSKIKEWLAASDTLITNLAASSGLNQPLSVAVDGAGNLYVADSGNNAIKKWTAATGVLRPLVTGLNDPVAVAVDALDNVYVADNGDNTVKELAVAFVDPTARTEPASAGTDALPVVLPAAENLQSPFAPASDQSWLTVSGVTNGVVSFAFTSAGAGTTGHITLLGQRIAVTQAASNIQAPILTSPVVMPDDRFVFSFTSSPSASFTALTTTNLALPMNQWTVAGNISNLGGGSFQFSIPTATNGPSWFFRIRSP